MDRGLYTAFLGMRSRQRTLDLIANNIANASTAGFKANRALYQTLQVEEARRLREGGAAPGAGAASAEGPGAVLTSGTTDFSPGPARQTGRSLDVALQGDGFFVVQTAGGERYTRAGNFTLDASGQLVTQRGDVVVGEGGAITLPPGEVSIDAEGTVSVNGREAGRLKLVRFDDPATALLKEGDSLFAATGGGAPQDAAGTTVAQGALESSNVNSISEMVAMLQNSREFDSLQRSITQMMSKAASEIGRI